VAAKGESPVRQSMTFGFCRDAQRTNADLVKPRFGKRYESVRCVAALTRIGRKFPDLARMELGERMPTVCAALAPCQPRDSNRRPASPPRRGASELTLNHLGPDPDDGQPISQTRVSPKSCARWRMCSRRGPASGDDLPGCRHLPPLPRLVLTA